MTRHSDRGGDFKLTPGMCPCINHVHMCTHNSDNGVRLQSRRAYRVLSARLATGFVLVPFYALPFQACTHNICPTLHTTLIPIPQRQFDSFCHTDLHRQT
jgi:hypothetical protein